MPDVVTTAVYPGDLILHDGERHLAIAVRGDRCLMLHVDDGLSRGWFDCSAFDGCPREENPWQFCHNRRRKAEATAQETIRTKGTDAALREAQRAGAWEALAHLAEALTHELPARA